MQGSVELPRPSRDRQSQPPDADVNVMRYEGDGTEVDCTLASRS